MKKTIFFSFLAVLLAAPMFAGVVFVVETTDHSKSSSPESFMTKVWAEGELLKATIAENSGQDGEMIYRGEKREMVVIDNSEKSYMVIDEAMIESIGGQLGSAMKQMEEALKNVPPEQRAMVENMMKQNMPQLAPTKEKIKVEMRKTSEKETQNGYPCVKYEVFEGGKKARELWVTEWSNVEGGSDVAASFESMANFFQGLLDALSSISGLGEGLGGMVDLNSFAHMKDLDGFPVLSRELDEDGNLESESVLRSAKRENLDPATFEPPKGYKLQQMFAR